MNHSEVIGSLDYCLGQHFYTADYLVDNGPGVSVYILSRDCDDGFPGASFDPSYARNIVMDLWYEDDRDGRVTNCYPGIIECDKEGRSLFESLNKARLDFKKKSLSYRKIDPNEYAYTVDAIKKGDGSVLGRASRYYPQFGRLSINHIYRQFCILSRRPHSITYFTSRNECSIRRVSKDEALSMLLSIDADLSSDHIASQFYRVSSLKDSEPLAVVRRQSPCIKANIAFPENGGERRVLANLPIIIPVGRFPVCIENRILQTSKRLGSRDDRLIESSPYASSIHLHRYIERD